MLRCLLLQLLDDLVKPLCFGGRKFTRLIWQRTGSRFVVVGGFVPWGENSFQGRGET